MWNPNCGPSAGSCGAPNWVCLPVPPTPPPPTTPLALNGPIRGDTSGNQAAAGNVGEFIQRSVTGTLTIGASATVLTTLTPMTLGPGDWDIAAKLDVSVLFTGAQFILNPTIPGASSNMFTSGFLPGVLHIIPTGTILAQRTQLVTASASSMLQFDVTVANFGSGSQTGGYTFTVNARRMR